MVGVAPLVDADEVRQFLMDAAAGALALVKRRFCDGISVGQSPTAYSVTTRARQDLDFARGLTMYSPIGAP